MFVHARNATVKTATALRDMAASNGELPLFAPEQSAQLGLAEKQVSCAGLLPAHSFIIIIVVVVVLLLLLFLLLLLLLLLLPMFIDYLRCLGLGTNL